MKISTQNSHNLAAYLTAGIGAGCLAGQADAATVVTFFGPGAQSPTSSPATPAGFDVGSFYTAGNRYIVDSAAIGAGYSSASNAYFTNGTNLSFAPTDTFGFGQYVKNGAAFGGAVLNSDQNFARLNFTVADSTFEAVGQFYLDGAGGGYLVALARNDDNSALNISAGKSAIDAVPEPSALALLALGAGGLIARRKRNSA
ncbi:MAG: PEP-CTERM sorting domain-containing protein [Verrucomicrobiota bacterium]